MLVICAVRLPDAPASFTERSVLQTFKKWPVMVIMIDIYFLKLIYEAVMLFYLMQ